MMKPVLWEDGNRMTKGDRGRRWEVFGGRMSPMFQFVWTWVLCRRRCRVCWLGGRRCRIRCVCAIVVGPCSCWGRPSKGCEVYPKCWKRRQCITCTGWALWLWKRGCYLQSLLERDKRKQQQNYSRWKSLWLVARLSCWKRWLFLRINSAIARLRLVWWTEKYGEMALRRAARPSIVGMLG
jgi:hypothetical protein